MAIMSRLISRLQTSRTYLGSSGSALRSPSFGVIPCNSSVAQGFGEPSYNELRRLLMALLVASLVVWYRTLGTVSVESVSTPRAEAFYWTTIMFSQTLGTALGDWTADTAGLGYVGAAVVFGSLLSLVAAAYMWSNISHASLFWAAFVLTRPLGAVVGDFLDKPIASGGLDLSRYSASAVLLVFIAACIVFFKHKPAGKSH
jgi:uncharacterized membrane-anchored protein